MTCHTRFSRRSFISFTLAMFLIIPAVALAAGQTPSIAGHWEGAIQAPGNAIAISVDFSQKPDGTFGASISIPAQGANDVPLANVSVAGSDVAFDLPGVPGDPKFRGKVEAGGAKISGDFMQGGAKLAFALERKADPSVAAREALVGFEEICTDAMKRLEVPGMAIAIVKNKEVIYSKGFGYRDVEKQMTVTPDTLFAIGSSTKAFTTFALGTLVDQGKLEWDKPVRNYIPWFRLYDPAIGEHLTPRDLVTHRSGLPRHDLVWYNNYAASRKYLVERLAYLEPSADLRERFQYNNLMFLTAGYLTEVITGQKWEDAIRDRILQPLGMTRTNFSVEDSQKDADFAEPYQKKDDKIVKMPFRPITNLGPAGAINSSVNEMSRWVMVHLNSGKFGDTQIASASTVADMHLPHMVTGAVSDRPDISSPDYAMGWFVDTYRGHRRVYHGGNIDGFSANVMLLPEDGIGFVVLTNMNGTGLRDLIVRVAADRLLKLSPVDWIGDAAKRRAVAEAAGKEARKKKEVVRVPGTHPAHKVEDYAGDYEHPGYGVLKVDLHEGHLETTYNGITTALEHWHYETFNGMKAADDTFEDMKYTFQTDAQGFVSALSVPFEPSVKDIVFTKKPDARLFDAEYLKRFLGSYELPNQVATVSLKSNSLVMQVGPQLPQELVPTVGGDFALKQARIVTLHFVSDPKGDVTAVEFRQPNGVFTAKRKQ
jgi:CubicO group peptidase (beta-lactamase class C family)